MSAKTNLWKLGLFVVTGIAGVVAALVWLGIERLEREVLFAYTYFDEPVDGLDIGAPVKLRGVPLGRVVDIRIAENRKHIEVKAALYVDVLAGLGLMDPEHPRKPPEPFVRPDLPLRAQLVSSLLTGLAFIEVDYYYGDEPIPTADDYGFVPEWATVHAVPSATKQLEKGVMETLASLPAVAKRFMSLADAVQQALADSDVPGLAKRIEKLLETTERQLAQLDVEGVNRGMAEARHSAQEIGEFVRDLGEEDGPLRTTVARIDASLDEIERALADADLGGTTATLRDAAADVSALGRSLTGAVPELRGALESFRSLAEMLERDPGALLHGRATPTARRGQR